MELKNGPYVVICNKYVIYVPYVMDHMYLWTIAVFVHVVSLVT